MEGRISSIQQPIIEYIRQQGGDTVSQRNAGGIIEEYDKTVSSTINQLTQITNKYVNAQLSDEEVRNRIYEIFEEFKKMISNHENKSIERGSFEYPEYEQPSQSDEQPSQSDQQPSWTKKYLEISQDTRHRLHTVYNAKQVENNNITDTIFAFHYVNNETNIAIDKYLSKLEDIASNIIKDAETLNKAITKFRTILYGLYIYEDVYAYFNNNNNKSDNNNKNTNTCKCSEKSDSEEEVKENENNIKKWFQEMIKIKQWILKQIDDNTIDVKDSDKLYTLIRYRLILTEMTSYMFDTTGTDDNIPVRPLINKISVGDRKLTYQDVAKKFIEMMKGKKIKDIEGIDPVTYFETYIKNVKEKSNIDIDFLFLLKQLHAQEGKDTQQYKKEKERVKRFMCALGTVFKGYIQQSIKGKTILKPIKFAKGNDILFKIDDIHMRAQETNICILYEGEKELQQFKDLLSRYEKYHRYITLTFMNKGSFADTSKHLINPININKLIPYFQELKNKIKDKNNIRNAKNGNDDDIGYKYLFFLLQMSAIITVINDRAKKNNVEPLIFSLITVNTKDIEDSEERHTYPVWNAVRTFARMIGIAMQTVDVMKDNKGEITFRSGLPTDAGMKNLIYSATRNIRELELKISTKFNVDTGKVFLIIEHESFEVIKAGTKAYFYEILEMDIKNNNVDKSYSITASLFFNNKTFMKGLFRTQWHDETIATLDKLVDDLKAKYPNATIIIITTDMINVDMKNYPQHALVSSLHSIKTPMPSKNIEKVNGFVIYADEFRNAIRYIVKDHEIEKKPAIAIQSLLPQSLLKDTAQEKWNCIVSPELSVFFPDPIKLGKTGSLDTFIIAVFTWLVFDSDAFNHKYVKPKILEKRIANFENISIKIGEKTTTIKIDGFTTVLELAYLWQRAYSRLVIKEQTKN